jgi:hypothetical protein
LAAELDFAPGFDELVRGAVSAAYGAVPARSTPDGSDLVFVSHEDLTNFQAGGKGEVYRFDSVAETLECLSCDPTNEEPVGDASLTTVGGDIGAGAPLSRYSQTPNLSPDGKRAFFESPDRLVPADNDGLTDVYEWEADGKGSCTSPNGCIFLISSGQSGKPNWLYGVSASGDDVFFLTSDLLTNEDGDATVSVYDARVDGGFPPSPAPAAECLGESCQPTVGAPVDVTPANGKTAGNVQLRRRHRHCVRSRSRDKRKHCSKGHHHHQGGRHRPRHASNGLKRTEAGK